MFITNKEKEWMVDAILNLQQQVKELSAEIDALKKINIARTPEAPWGLKMNGTPRKRPGRVAKKESKNELP